MDFSEDCPWCQQWKTIGEPCEACRASGKPPFRDDPTPAADVPRPEALLDDGKLTPFAREALHLSPRPEPSPPEDEAARAAHAFAWETCELDGPGFERIGGCKSCHTALATLLRSFADAAERRGYERGLEEAAKECEAEIASYDSGTHEYFSRGVEGCWERIRALRERAGSGK